MSEDSCHWNKDTERMDHFEDCSCSSEDIEQVYGDAADFKAERLNDE